MTEKISSKKRKLFIIAPITAILLVVCTMLGIRIYPVWKDAELTIRQSENVNENPLIDPNGMTLATRILPPEGYTRVSASEGSFAEYLRNYPLLPDGTELPVFDGSTQSANKAAAIFDISLTADGNQQCADSVIRLYSDYFRESNQNDRISFHFTNGFLCDFERWQKGRRVLAIGPISVGFPAALPSDSQQVYMNYLKEVMRYAGTLSLIDESETISADMAHTGDFICNSVHVVLIVDEAVNENGDRIFLIGQSFIPSVCFHILNNKNNDDSPWFTEEQLEAENISISHYQFQKDDLRRWMGGFSQ